MMCDDVWCCVMLCDDMTCSYQWHDSFECVTQHPRIARGLCDDVWRCVLLCDDVWWCVMMCYDVRWYVIMCDDVTFSYQWHDSFECVTRLYAKHPLVARGICDDVWRCVMLCDDVWWCVTMCYDVWWYDWFIPVTWLIRITGGVEVSHIHMWFNATHCNTPPRCNTLQQTGTLCNTPPHCNTLQHTATHCNTLRYTVAHCNILQHTATLLPYLGTESESGWDMEHARHPATHHTTLQHTATPYITLQHTPALRNTLQHAATHCNTVALPWHRRQEWGGCGACEFHPGAVPPDPGPTCVLQCVAVCCSVLQCVAVCCSVLQCVAVCCIT